MNLLFIQATTSDRLYSGHSAAVTSHGQSHLRTTVDRDKFNNEDDDDDDDNSDDNNELFHGFVAPRVANTGDTDDADVYKKPSTQPNMWAQAKAPASSSVGTKSSAKSKFSSKLAATVSSSHQHQADFGCVLES